MKQRLLLLLYFTFLYLNSSATHIVGGNFELHHLNGYSYRLELKLFFDDIHGDPERKDRFVKIGIFEKGTNRPVKAMQLPLRSESAIEYTNVGCTTSDLRTSIISYNEDIYLDPAIYNSPNGYYIASEICCRNSPITNMATGEAGTTFYMEFPAVLKNGAPFRNSSPKLSPPPTDFACVGELFYYNFGSTDTDGDKLVYDLVSPLRGHSMPGKDAIPPASPAPYAEIQWLPGYDKTKQIQGSPALKIDKTTGRLEVRPNSLGVFVFGVRCQEFRNGVKIGEVRRDFQLLVKACHRNGPPEISSVVPGNSSKPYQEGQVLRINSTDPRCIKVLFTDPDESESISLEAKPANFNNSFFSVTGSVSGTVNSGGNQNKVLEATLCLDACFDTNGGIYIFDLIVSDEGSDGCSLPTQDTVQVSLMVEPLPNRPSELALSTAKRVMEVSEGDVISFEVIGTDADNEEITVTATGRHFDIGSQNITFESKTGFGQVTSPFIWEIDCETSKKPSYQVEFAVISNSCGKQVIKTEVVEFITKRYDISDNIISDDQVICYGETPKALAGSLPTGGRGPFIYTWEISMSGAKNDFLPAPGLNNEQHYTPPKLDQTAWYRRKVTSGICNESLSPYVKVVEDILQPSAGEDITIIQGGLAGLNATGGKTYSWSPATGISDTNIHNPIAKPAETTTYTVTVTTDYGCVYTDEVTLTVLPRVEPTNAITLNHDNINDTWNIKNIEYYPECRVQVFTRWGSKVFESKGYREPWNGTHNGNELPMSAYFYIIDLGINEATISGSITLLK